MARSIGQSQHLEDPAEVSLASLLPSHSDFHFGFVKLKCPIVEEPEEEQVAIFLFSFLIHYPLSSKSHNFLENGVMGRTSCDMA